jgi:hypothetical protein
LSQREAAAAVAPDRLALSPTAGTAALAEAAGGDYLEPQKGVLQHLVKETTAVTLRVFTAAAEAVLGLLAECTTLASRVLVMVELAHPHTQRGEARPHQVKTSAAPTTFLVAQAAAETAVRLVMELAVAAGDQAILAAEVRGGGDKPTQLRRQATQASSSFATRFRRENGSLRRD